MSPKIKAAPTVFRGRKAVQLYAGRAARFFVPLEQLREVADLLHDHADEYEEAQRDGRAPIQ